MNWYSHLRRCLGSLCTDNDALAVVSSPLGSPRARLAAMGAILALVLSQAGIAAQHEVEVLANRFQPEVVVIAPGDRVTWTVVQGTHALSSITGNQGVIFQSGMLELGEEFSFLFDEAVGEVLYQSSAYEGMQGAIVIQDHQATFAIDARINAAWLNPNTPGQGMLLEYVPDSGSVVVYWFTFSPTQNRQLWLVGVGVPDDNRVSFVLLAPQGGRLNDSQAVTKPTWGELTLVFADCYNATAYFEANEAQRSGHFPLQRLYLSSLCQ